MARIDTADLLSITEANRLGISQLVHRSEVPNCRWKLM